jgi:hypothetical protein
VSRRIWYTWEVAQTSSLASGQSQGIEVRSGTCDQDVRVRLIARTDSRYSLEIKSRD